MNRLPRNICGNGFFHVMVQGINKEYIFNKGCYKKEYVKLLTMFKNKFNISIISYCIMDNHAHLIIYTDDVCEMSKFMKCINCRFAKLYNINEARVGYVFRDRFNSQYIHNSDYLLRCIHYIHMNPVKAGLVSNPIDYEYSSYSDYINKNNFINNTIIKLVFGSVKNYLDSFLKISNEDFEVMDIDRENKNFEIATKEFLTANSATIQDLKSNRILFKKFVEEVIFIKKYKQIQVANLLGISSSTMSKKILALKDI